jgi:hypothetical protein
MKINDVYDIIGPHGPIPNGYNPNHYDLFVKHDFEQSSEFYQDYQDTYGAIQVNKPRLLRGLFKGEYCINEITYNKDTNTIGNSDEIYIYTITAFSNILATLGMKEYENSVFSNISSTTLEYLNAKNFYLVLEYQMEGYNDRNILDKIYFECKKHKINPTSIIFITSTLNISELHDEYLQQFPQTDKIKICLFNWAIPFKNFELKTVLYDKIKNEKYKKSSIVVESDLNKPKTKKFLCLNRRLRFHRILLLSLLENENLLENSFTSYDMNLNLFPFFIDKLDDHHFKRQRIFYNEEYKQKAKDGYKKLLNNQKRIVDYDNIESLEGYGWESKDIYTNSYFSIVTETEFQDNTRFISEKTIKPIMQYHPFVLVGSPYTLKELKTYGFKTFNDFWDESYDEMESPNDRMIALFNLCKNLINKSKNEWNDMYNEMLPILKHNRNLLLKYDEHSVKQIVKENLIKLLDNNNQTYIKLF